VFKRLASVAVVLGLAATCAVAPTASPSAGLVKGIYDEAQTLYGNPDKAFPMLGQLRTEALRVNLYWGGEFGVSTGRRPVNAINPDDLAYDWGIYDRTVNYAAQYGIKVVFSIWGTPGWANRFRGLRSAPLNPADLQKFAYAAARRYSGNWVADDGRGIPRVDHWIAWNEPNNPAFLYPQYRLVKGKAVIASAKDYAKICNAINTGVKQARIRAQKVACGVTAPRGNNNPGTLRASISPLPFLRAMKLAGAKGFDAYAHHPYYGKPTETPATKPPPAIKSTSVSLGNINDLVKEVTRLYGRKPIWITEYGYQTKPQDPTFGVSYGNQAKYLTQAFSIARKNPRIDMMLWFLIRDDTRAAGWQSGFITSSGARKPSFLAFQRVPK
jgi:hypothetical protein